jgi:pterin-4a-carbinolamine dehydratase
VPDLDALASNTVSRSTMDPEHLREGVAALGTRWSIDGMDLTCQLRGAPMAKCGAAAAYAAKLADEMDHHPTIVLEYAGMTLKIHTHDVKAITVLDLVYGARLERWLRANGWA